MIIRRLTLSHLCALIGAIGGLALAASPALAFNEHITPPTSFGAACAGTPCGTGQFSNPDGIAVEQSTGDVYVVDTGEDRVEKFSAAGTYITQFGSAGSGPGQLNAPTWVVVDDSGLTPNVYVDDAGNKRVEEFEPTGAYVSQLTGTPTGAGGAVVPFSEVGGVAVDPSGNVWVAAGEYVDEFGADGSLITMLTEASEHLLNRYTYAYLTDLVVNSKDDFYGLHKGTSQGRGDVIGWTPDGKNLLGEIDSWQKTTEYEDTSVTIDPGNATLGGIDGFYIAENEYFPANAPSQGQALGYAVSQYAPTCIQESKETESAGCSRLEAIGVGSLGRTAGVAVDASTGALYVVQPESDAVLIYAATVVPDVTTAEATDLHPTSAKLNGVVDPDGTVIASCEFEYISKNAYEEALNAGASNPYAGGASKACSPVPVSGASPVTVTAEATGLEPEEEYDYRLVATNGLGVRYGANQIFFAAIPPVISNESASEVAPVTSETSVRASVVAQIDAGDLQTMYHVEYGETTAYGSSTAEMSVGNGVGPVDVTVHINDLRPATTYHIRFVASNALGVGDGEDVSFTTASLSPDSSLLPDGRAFELVSTGDSRLGNVYVPLGHETGTEFQAGPPERSSPSGEAVVYVGAPSGVGGNGNEGTHRGNSYLATRSEAGWAASNITPANSNYTAGYKGFSSSLSVGALDMRQSENNIPTPITPGGPATGSFIRAEDGSFHLLTGPFGKEERREASEEAYRGATPDFSKVVIEVKGNLYMDEWKTGQLSPALNVSPGGTVETGAVFDAISTDGSEVVWSGGGKLYVSGGIGTSEARTVQVDTSQGPGPGASGAFAEGISGESPDDLARSFNGSQIFFTDSDSAGLTEDTVAGSGNNLYEFEVATGRLTDLTPATHTEVQNVVGTSQDGSYVYFTADGVLTKGVNAEGKEPVDGAANLYLYREGETRFIASNVSGRQVSPDGLHFLLQSNVSGALYVYDVDSDMLDCTSCLNGAPIGVGLGNNVGANEGLYEIERYVPHWMNDEGDRVFFEAGSLVPQDTIGASVYEWEKDGTGSCQIVDGCVYLISGGTNRATFVDASSNGDNVFFTTYTQLVPQDTNDYVDLYDARIGATPPSPPLCSGAGCQGVPGAAPIFATPSSVTFNGVGDFEPPTTTSVLVKTKSARVKCRSGFVKKKNKCERRVKDKKRTARKSGTRSTGGKK